MAQPDPPAHPFGSTVPGARALVQSIAEGVRPAGAIASAARPSDDQVGAWLDAGGGDVAAAIRGYDRLASDAEAGYEGQDDLVTSIVARAKNLTELYAGSLLANVAYPERGGGRSLGDTLYDRFEKGLARLTGEVRAELERLDLTEPTDVGEEAAAAFGPVAQFPAPFLRDAAGRPLRF
jgi:hypothetical protein